MSTAEMNIRKEMKKRTDLIEQKEFRELCADWAKELGLTEAQWNENRAKLYLFFANKVIVAGEK
jgi:hypothetical protein